MLRILPPLGVLAAVGRKRLGSLGGLSSDAAQNHWATRRPIRPDCGVAGLYAAPVEYDNRMDRWTNGTAWCCRPVLDQRGHLHAQAARGDRMRRWWWPCPVQWRRRGLGSGSSRRNGRRRRRLAVCCVRGSPSVCVRSLCVRVCVCALPCVYVWLAAFPSPTIPVFRHRPAPGTHA